MNEMVAASGGKEEDASVVRGDDAEGNQPGKGRNGVLHVRWMVERRMEENEGMMKEEAMRDGVKRCVFRFGNGPR